VISRGWNSFEVDADKVYISTNRTLTEIRTIKAILRQSLTEVMEEVLESEAHSYYKVAKHWDELCLTSRTLWKAEFESSELRYLVENISRQQSMSSLNRLW
jgi:hypothetical protein